MALLVNSKTLWTRLFIQLLSNIACKKESMYTILMLILKYKVFRCTALNILLMFLSLCLYASPISPFCFGLIITHGSKDLFLFSNQSHLNIFNIYRPPMLYSEIIKVDEHVKIFKKPGTYLPTFSPHTFWPLKVAYCTSYFQVVQVVNSLQTIQLKNHNNNNWPSPWQRPNQHQQNLPYLNLLPPRIQITQL